MANHYLQFSVTVTANEKTVEWAKKQFAEQSNDDENTGFELESYGDGELYVFDEESGDPEAAANFIQEVLQFSDSEQIVLLEFAMTCSKPRPGEFGGGAVLISRERIEYPESDYAWFNRISNEIKESREEKKEA